MNGSVTAGNSSQTSDGASAVIVTSSELARERGLTPMARFVATEAGLITHERRIYDFTGLLVQVGVLRAKPVG